MNRVSRSERRTWDCSDSRQVHSVAALRAVQRVVIAVEAVSRGIVHKDSFMYSVNVSTASISTVYYNNV
jgi:hypothetical protein